MRKLISYIQIILVWIGFMVVYPFATLFDACKNYVLGVIDISNNAIQTWKGVSAGGKDAES